MLRSFLVNGPKRTTAAATDRIPFRIQPMLATLVQEPVDLPGWVFEEKYDGYRLLAYKEGRTVTLLSRNGNDRTAAFREIAAAVTQLRARTLLLDGEGIATGSGGVSRFQELQQGGTNAFAAFDCLFVDGQDLRGESLSSRRSALESAIRGVRGIFPSRRLEGGGLRAFEFARRAGWEGIVGKDDSAPYTEGRSRKWLKFKIHQQDEFVIGGFTAPAGTRLHFGALLLGAWENSGLVFTGKVGTGFSSGGLERLYAAFQPLIQPHSPFVNSPRERNITWLRPTLVAQIAFQEWTGDRKLRQPVFLGLRDDKPASECRMPVPVTRGKDL
jgi:bifunctional non-homologous end joining protein LigD